MTDAERDEMILSLAPLIGHIAHHRRAILPQTVTFDEIVSAAWEGAIDAVSRFDPEKHVKLDSYARWRINGAIGDYLRSLDPVSRDERRKMKADPTMEVPRTLSLTHLATSARHDNEGGKVFDIGDKRSLRAISTLEARLAVQKIIRRAGAKPRSISIVKRHASGETMKAIGRSLGINESRVSQIRKETLEKLRAAA